MTTKNKSTKATPKTVHVKVLSTFTQGETIIGAGSIIELTPAQAAKLKGSVELVEM